MPGFDEVKQVDAGVLSVGYLETGPANGPAVLLLHGWPYDIHAFGDVAHACEGRYGYQVVVVVEGFGYGHSHTRAPPRTIENITTELHTALPKVGVE